MTPSLLFIGKKDDFYCERAKAFVEQHFPERQILLGKRGESFAEGLETWQGDYIISYLSPWIIPDSLLKKARRASINFHPRAAGISWDRLHQFRYIQRRKNIWCNLPSYGGKGGYRRYHRGSAFPPL